MTLQFSLPRLADVLNVLYILIGMLFVTRSGLMEEDAVEVLQCHGFHMSSFLM